jgi:hypothetical protein
MREPVHETEYSRYAEKSRNADAVATNSAVFPSRLFSLSRIIGQIYHDSVSEGSLISLHIA